jgi:hypothetical protein
MKKLLFMVIAYFSLTVTQGQLNPIKNLNLWQTYESPKNCFHLSWSAPDSSKTDTLIGYNIYGNDSLYKFTINTSIACNPCIGAPDSIFSDCGFFWLNHGDQFYVYVKAVYNWNHLESGYTDSAFGGGYAIGINEHSEKRNFVFFSPNPAQNKITIEIPQTAGESILTIFNINGQELIKQNITENKTQMDISDLPHGIYFVKMANEKTVDVKKIIKE